MRIGLSRAMDAGTLARVLFDGVAPAKAVCDVRVVGAVAQLGERLVRNEEVSGSIPLSSTKQIHAHKQNQGPVSQDQVQFLGPRCCVFLLTSTRDIFSPALWFLIAYR